MARFLQLTMLLLCLIAGSTTSSADKLYLSGIECINHTFPNSSDFSFKSLFQYDDNDDIVQMDINNTINEMILKNYITLPASVTFKFDYKEGVLKTAEYMDSNGKSLTGTVDIKSIENGKIVETSISDSKSESNEVFKVEYDENGLLVKSERISTSDTEISDNDDSMIEYIYIHNTQGQISRIELSNGKYGGCWSLDYGNSGEIEKCYYTDYQINTPVMRTLEFSYLDIEDCSIVAPNPIQFIYDTLYKNVFTCNNFAQPLSIPECIAQILYRQQNHVIRTISEYSGQNNKLCDFELKYQTERPTAGVAEVMMPADANPEYYNLQGQKVAAPEEGSIYIVKRGSKASKEVYRR